MLKRVVAKLQAIEKEVKEKKEKERKPITADELAKAFKSVRFA